jgi:hypothetical protein
MISNELRNVESQILIYIRRFLFLEESHTFVANHPARLAKLVGMQVSHF